jgi:hypothetical protein
MEKAVAVIISDIAAGEGAEFGSPYHVRICSL